jgi:predicted lipid-binding transport protein (Tim44 family)
VSTRAPSNHRRPAGSHRRPARALPPESIQSRRVAAARVRRRRLLVGDLLLGLLLGLIGLAIGPGLAVVAIAALAVLLAMGVWGALRARKKRLRMREAPTSLPRDAESSAPLHGEARAADEQSFGY